MSKTGTWKVQPGDLVRILAPAGKGSQANLPKIKSYVESLGLVAQISANIYDPSEPLYSNTDEFRATDLISALTDDNCKVIWCIRGGAGCIRLIRDLETQLPDLAPTPKILIGYSDITVLHLYLTMKYNWPTVHGPMLEGVVNGQYDPEGESVTSLLDLMFNKISLVCEPELTRLDLGGAIGTISTEVIGGNLTLVETSIGTGWEVNAVGKILFLEDVGEAAYSVERSLDHMKQAGLFDGAAAIVFGDFTNPDDPNLIQLVLQRFVEDGMVNCPVFKLEGVGHGSKNIPLPFNTKADINQLNAGSSTYLLCVNNLP